MNTAARTTHQPTEDQYQSPREVGRVISFEETPITPVRVAHPIADELYREMTSLGVVGNAPKPKPPQGCEASSGAGDNQDRPGAGMPRGNL